MRLAVGVGLTQVVIEATIQAARWTMGTHTVPFAGEGSGYATTGTTNGKHLGGVVLCLNVPGSSDAKKRGKQTQMKHFNHLNPPGFNDKTPTVEAEEWLRKIRKMLNTIRIFED